MSSITPKEMSREDWANHVSSAYRTLRYHASIPDEVIDTMRGRLLGAPALEARIVELERDLRAAKDLADLWYFVMDEVPLKFETIVTTYSPAHWMSAAAKLRAALQGASK